MKAMLEVDNIHVYRGRTYVLQGISLEVERGRIVALIGPNGAGKTTTLRTISGLLRPREGSIRYRPDEESRAVDLTRPPAEDIVAHGIAHCPEGRGVLSQMTVRENLLIGAYLRRDKEAVAQDLERVHRMFPILKERHRQVAGSLSGGEQEMLAIGRSLMSSPRLLILDEPSLGLAPIVVNDIFEMLREINTRGVTVLLVEQNAVQALDLAHQAYVMETGQIPLCGACLDLAQNPKVKELYLGGGG